MITVETYSPLEQNRATPSALLPPPSPISDLPFPSIPLRSFRSLLSLPPNARSR